MEIQQLKNAFKMSTKQKHKYLIKFTCKSPRTGELYYPFAENPRLMFIVADRLRRHRTIDQSGIYLKQNPGDASMTIADIKNLVKNGQCKLNSISK